jgi:hypothetical protein
MLKSECLKKYNNNSVNSQKKNNNSVNNLTMCCNYEDVCSEKQCIYQREGIGIKEYSAFLYNSNNKPCSMFDTYFISHSSRIEDNLIWHKFNGNNFLFAINSTDDIIKHLNICVLKEISIYTVPVPLNFYLDDKDEMIKYIIHKD